MLYLKASTVAETLDEYNGKKGMFIKTFAFNTERNKNGWRVTWPSIKKNISDFSKNLRPGIEYTKCTQAGCDLDHTEATTYEASLQVQEPFRVTNIIDYLLNENEETSFFIHETDDAVFFEKVKTGEIKYVSPSIWPVEVVFLGGYMPNGEPILDVYDWLALHDAFVNDPAFGEEAKVVATCEGDNCQMKMLSAKKNPELASIPIMIKHKEKLHYVSVSAVTKKQIDESPENNLSNMMEILKNNSLNACACSSKIAMAEKSEKEQLEAVQAALKAAEQSKKDSDDKVKDLEAKLTAATEKIEKMAKNGAIAACGKCGSTDHTTDNHTDENSKDASSKNAKALAASVKSLEAKVAKPMIDEMLKARTEAGATEDEIKAFKTSLDAKSLADIESQYNSEKVFMTAVSAKTEEKIHFDFNDNHALSAKTDKPLEEIFQEIA